MTSEKLAEFRAKGMLLDPKFDRLAQIGDRKKEQEKKLSIKYLSDSTDDKYINIKFSIETPKIKSSTATVFIQEMNAKNEEAKTTIATGLKSNSYQSITVSFDKNKEFDKYSWQDDYSFQATITIDSLSAKSEEFVLKREKKKPEKEEKCLCKKSSWTADDLKKIVKQLRKSEDKHFETQYDERRNPYFVNEKGEIVKSNDRGRAPKEGYEKYKIEKTFYDSKANDGKLVGDRLFYLERNENINEFDNSYERLAEALNYIFKKLDAKKCINKIHILCQIYHETERFGSCYESDVSAGKSGEDFYRGRGLIMITKKSNYKIFYEETYKKTPTDLELETLVPKVAKELNYAKLTASWYLNKSKIKQYFNEEDSVLNVSACINRPKSLIDKKYDEMYGITERKMYFEYLKQIFDYENCK